MIRRLTKRLVGRSTGSPLRFALVVACTALITQAAVAEDASAPPAPVPAEPQQTSASFGDWVVRCQRVGDPAKRVCEAAQSLVVKGQQAPIAQIALGTAQKDLMITVLLPTNISFGKPPKIGTDEAHMTPLVFRRCVPAGCLADSKLDTGRLKDIRGATKQGQLVFTDAAERTLALPVSFRGLAQALDDLTKEAAVQ